MKRKWGLIRVGIFSFLGALLLSIALAAPSQAHWADLAVANVEVGQAATHITLTFPTGLVASADDNRDGTLSPGEVQRHQAALAAFLGDRIRLTDSKGDRGRLTIEPSNTTVLPPDQQVTAGTHSTLRLTYIWSKPVEGLTLHYDLFLPGVSTARCLTTINASGQTQSVIFSPDSKDAALMEKTPWYFAGGIPLAIVGCFVWGAMHAMAPGHGKTIVGAYLVGAHATPQHAVFLGLTTTITHTAGVFALGLGTLFFSQYVLPERLYPWLSFISGLIVVDIGLRQLLHRLHRNRLSVKGTLNKGTANHIHDDRAHHLHEPAASHHPASAHHHVGESAHVHAPAPSHSPSHAVAHAHEHSYDGHHHSHGLAQHRHEHSHEHDHHHNHDHYNHDRHEHVHDHGDGTVHSHALPGSDGAPVTWRSLLALGISGGMVPCPSALVMLLSAIALGRVGFGLLMVLVFSLGLAGTLTALGLMLVSARHLFERLPTQLRVTRLLPAVSALVITLLGIGISMQAVMQIGLLKLNVGAFG
ncbi:MAG: sulfite exporter TauE/SafE family protein [Lyngbya sp. HA4199-MV5]|jgi:ABC-type nickel/cobalt efflux system permease component RcnA|nr:sulfite exporter TauE/SafE family protein [Lyngbya sp. HA4199-MV5]